MEERPAVPLAIGLRFQWLAAALFWTFIAALIGLQIWFLTLRPGESIELRRAVVWQSAFYVLWIPLTVPIWQAIARWQVERTSWWRLLLRHIGIGLAVCVLHSLMVTAVSSTIHPTPGETLVQLLPGQIRGRIYSQIVVYAGIAGAGHAFAMYARWREQYDRAIRLEGQLAEATLSALRAQLHPHLLFNSLHTVSALVRESRNTEAVKLIGDIGDLLRRVLDTDKVWHSVDEELALVKTYVDVQRARFEDRLEASFEIEPGTGAMTIPVLVMQPLVENALRHGLAGKVGTGHLRVTVAREAGQLTVTVADDGVGRNAAGPEGTGTGLGNLRARLATLYGGQASLHAGPRPEGGFSAVVKMPIRT